MPVSVILLLFILLVVVPLFAAFAGPRYRDRRPLAVLVAVPLLLFIINAPLHEFAHMLGTWLGGGRVAEYNLVMKFWAPHPQVPMIVTSGLETVAARATASFFPYAVALGFLVAGFGLGPGVNGFGPMLQGAFFLLFVLRPSFDIVSNLVSHLCFGLGDFKDLSAFIPPPIVGVVEAGLALVVAVALAQMILVARAVDSPHSVAPTPRTSPPTSA